MYSLLFTGKNVLYVCQINHILLLLTNDSNGNSLVTGLKSQCLKILGEKRSFDVVNKKWISILAKFHDGSVEKTVLN